MDSQGLLESHTWMLRNWHLTVLRFAVTHENADRLGVLAAANEIDGLGRQYGDKTGFEYFRKMSLQLCAAMLTRGEGADEILRQYLARIDDVRLKRALAATLEIELPQSVAEKRRSRPGPSLWRGLASRSDKMSRLNRLR